MIFHISVLFSPVYLVKWPNGRKGCLEGTLFGMVFAIYLYRNKIYKKEIIMNKFKIEDLLDEDLIFMNVRAADSESLLHTLSEELQTRGYVKPGYADAVIRRERIYPTGLPTNIMKVAVPHAIERDYVLEPHVLVAVLDEPVAFKEMGDGIRDVMVNIVFLLAVCGSNDQLTILQKIVGMFSDAAVMADIKKAADRTALHQILKKHLSD